LRGPLTGRLPVGLVKIIRSRFATIARLLLLVQTVNFPLAVLIHILPAVSASFLPVVSVLLKYISLPVGHNIIIRRLC
jgi:hypothetical protein